MRYLLDALASARTVWVDLVDDQATGPDGQVLVINFADKTLRSRLEKGLILQACQTDSKVLNRGGNPGWDDARSV